MGYFLDRAKTLMGGRDFGSDKLAGAEINTDTRLAYTLAQHARQESEQSRIECERSEESEERSEGLAAIRGLEARLHMALAKKGKELALRKTDLASPYYADDSWCLKQITYLEAQIAEIQRYFKEAGSLNLPRCCNRQIICLAATRGFTSCIWESDSCYYALGRGSKGR